LSGRRVQSYAHMHLTESLTWIAGNISSVDAKALPGNDSRHVQLKLCLKETPDILLDHFDASDK